MDSDLYDKLTPRQKSLLKVLSDGKEHPREELWAVMGDPYLCSTNLAADITGIRKALKSTNELIHVERRTNGDGKPKTFYQWLKLVPREAR